MRKLDDILAEIGETARSETSRNVDVRARVLSTIADRQSITKLDVVPIAFGFAAAGMAATLAIAFLPDLQTMMDPWASYFAR